MSAVLLDPVSAADRAAAEDAARRRTQLDLIAYGCRREREVWCFAPTVQTLALGAVLSIRNDRLYNDLAARARKPSPATSDPTDRRPTPTPRKARARRRQRRKR